MTDVLGYRHFAAQGGDWGAFVCSRLGALHADKIVGIHINFLAVRRDPTLLQNSSAEERRYAAELAEFLKEETGYQWIQGTRPQTLAFGLSDSPAGLAAWIVEKFRAWTDNDGTPDTAVERDRMLAEYIAILVHGLHRRILSSVLRQNARPVAHRRHSQCSGGLLPVPKESHPATAFCG